MRFLLKKSVYIIFEMARNKLPEYQKEVLNNSFTVMLHRVYVELCKSTHTATSADMEHITALRLLPKYDKEQSNDYKECITVLIDSFLGFFLVNHMEVINGMYRKNNDIIYDVLPRNIIKDIVNK